MLLERAIIQALEKVVPNTLFILSGRQGVEPPFPYCLVTLVSTTNIGQPDRAATYAEDGSSLERIIQNKRSEFHLTFLSQAKDDFQDLAEVIQTGFGSSFFIQTFYGEGLGIESSKTLVPTVEVESSIGKYMCTTIKLVVTFQRINEFKADRINKVETVGYDENDVPLVSVIVEKTGGN